MESNQLQAMEQYREPPVFLDELVTRRVDELRPHPSFLRHQIAFQLRRSSPAEQQGDSTFRTPLVITRERTIIDGYARYELARQQGRQSLPCIEHELSDIQALQWILRTHRRSNGLNDFSRIVLALDLERSLQEEARAHQKVGGEYKGSANLPKAEPIDVREQIAKFAGVSPRNVSNVKTILRRAHSQLIEALHNGTIKINRAQQLCEFERSKQVEELARFLAERSSSKTARQFVDQLRPEQVSADMSAFLAQLQELESINPGSVEVRPGTRKKTVILVGKGHLSDLASLRMAGSV